MADEKEQLPAREFIDLILDTAMKERASDVHIEPRIKDMRIRFRIDGILHEKWIKPLYELEAIINRIKVLTNIDITIRDIPQEGHFLKEILQGQAKQTESAAPHTDEQSNVIDMRVSIFPTVYGESVVLRLLDQKNILLSLDKLGMDTDALATYKSLISKLYGMVLITGPSGAGKSTTLYSTLLALRSSEKNIVTLEDPVELHLENIRQTQISETQRTLTYATGLQRILRQDPDVIMIGEIRDPETAEQAVRASLMGRIVLSTIHANSALGTIARLIDMEVERSLVAYALNGVISQRLVRTICSSCRIAYTPDPKYLAYFDLNTREHEFMKGSGCEVCHKTGYAGRTSIAEVLEIDDDLELLIVERAPMHALVEYVAEKKMPTLKSDAIKKILAGITTCEEAARAV